MARRARSPRHPRLGGVRARPAKHASSPRSRSQPGRLLADETLSNTHTSPSRMSVGAFSAAMASASSRKRSVWSTPWRLMRRERRPSASASRRTSLRRSSRDGGRACRASAASARATAGALRPPLCPDGQALDGIAQWVRWGRPPPPPRYDRACGKGGIARGARNVARATAIYLPGFTPRGAAYIHYRDDASLPHRSSSATWRSSIRCAPATPG